MRASLRFNGIYVWLLLIAVAATLLTWQGVTVGDDLGYCFSDARLHAGGGDRVESVGQILATQTSHFLHFNGRVIVHSLVQLMLMPGWRLVYCLINGLMFSLLWFGVLRLCGFAFSFRAGAVVLGLMLLLLPAPGVIYFSLVAFSVNYLWPGVGFVWLLVAMRRRGFRRSWPLLLAAVLLGALQESYSLPMTGALLLAWLMVKDRRLLWYALAMGCGTLALLLAPGNYSHAAAGGGFSLPVLLHKTHCMAADTLRTPLPWLLLLSGIVALTPRRRVLKPDKLELILLSAIGCSVLLGVLSYTALRQLVAPSVWAVVLILRVGNRCMHLAGKAKSILGGVAFCVSVAIIIVAAVIRQETVRRMESVVREIGSGEQVVWIDNSGASYNFPLGGWLQGWDDDPFADDLLHIVFDSNTRKGLRRLHGEGKLKRQPEILPVTRDSLRRAASMLPLQDRKGMTHPRRLDASYALISVARGRKLPDLRYADESHMPFASVAFGDTICMIVPGEAELVKIHKIYPNNK